MTAGHETASKMQAAELNRNVKTTVRSSNKTITNQKNKGNNTKAKANSNANTNAAAAAAAYAAAAAANNAAFNLHFVSPNDMSAFNSHHEQQHHHLHPQMHQAFNNNTAPSQISSSSTSSSPSWNDILKVQNLIERCLQQHLSKVDILNSLKSQAQIEPEFTNVVWQKLEEQNPSFFQAYAIQLQLKEQVNAFNFLVNQQKEMMMKLSGYGNNSTTIGGNFVKTNKNNKSNIHVDPRTIDPRPTKSNSGKGDSTMSTTNSHMAASLPIAFSPHSPLPLPSPIKTDLDTHAFFT